MMKFYIAVGVWFASSFCFAEECTFDRAAQLKHTKQIFAANSGGRLDENTLSITWQNKNSPAHYYAYGGCHHLGVVVRKQLMSSREPEESKLFSIASAMATAFLSAAQHEALMAGIANRSFSVSRNTASIHYRFQNNLYSEFSVEYNKNEHAISIRIVENL